MTVSPFILDRVQPLLAANSSSAGASDDGAVAADQCGGACIATSATAAFLETTFTNNSQLSTVANDTHTSTYMGGALAALGAKAASLTSCTLRNNKAAYDGGAVALINVDAAVLKSCAFESNTAIGARNLSQVGVCQTQRSSVLASHC